MVEHLWVVLGQADLHRRHRGHVPATPMRSWPVRRRGEDVDIGQVGGGTDMTWDSSSGEGGSEWRWPR